MHGGKTSAIGKFQHLIGKTILVCTEKAFTSYVPIFAEETESFKKPNVNGRSSGALYLCRRCHRKTTNVFVISRASVSAIIKKISYVITTFSGPEPIKLPTTGNKVTELANK